MYDILAMIYFKYTDAAFVIPESKVDIILGRADMVVNGQDLFRPINFIVRKFKRVQDGSSKLYPFILTILALKYEES